jgi:4-amino-4-deoxy-L-arabinose transferase-like glycosyltransferase
MTSTELSGSKRLAKRQTYRRLMVGCIVAGVLAAIALRNLGYPLASEAVYWLGIVGFLAVWKGTSIQLFDERDCELERRACQRTLLVVGAVGVLVASSARVLDAAGVYTAPPVVWHVLLGYVILFATFGVVYVWTRYRR